MGDYDSWSVNRLGRASRATTPPGQPPQYGLAYDLARSDLTHDQFQALVADAASLLVSARLAFTNHATMVQSDPAEIQREWDIVRNFNNYGVMGMTSDMFRNFLPGSAESFAGVRAVGETETDGFDIPFGGIAKTALRGMGVAVPDEKVVDTALVGGNVLKGQIFGGLGQALSDPEAALGGGPSLFSKLTGNDSVDRLTGRTDYSNSLEGVSYGEYRAYGGILTEEAFASLPPLTQRYALQRAKNMGKLRAVSNTPVIKEVLWGLDKAYYGAGTGFQMWGNRKGLLDPGWFKASEWDEAWQEANQQSLGNSIINGIFEPFVGQDTIDRWKRDSPFYDLSSTVSEFGLGWYLDAGVLLTKGAGGLARYGRGEMPLNIDGKLHTAVTQNLQREEVTIGGLRGKVGEKWAQRMDKRAAALEEFMATASKAEVEALPMFHRRALNGSPLALAWQHMVKNFPETNNLNLNDLVRKNAEEGNPLHYDDPRTLARQMAFGDPKAWQDFNKIKMAGADELKAWAPEGSRVQDWIDAMEGATTRLKQLQKEQDDLIAQSLETGKTGYSKWEYDWLQDRKIADKAADIAELKETLRKYEGFDEFVANFERNGKSTISRVDTHLRRTWVSSSYGNAGVFAKITRPVWLQRGNVAILDDPQSGFNLIRSTFDQLDHLTHRVGEFDLDDMLDKYHRAKTPHERYNLLHDTLENGYVLRAIAEDLGVDYHMVHRLYKTVVEKQNRMLGAFSDIIRSSEPTLFQNAPGLNAAFNAEMALSREGIENLKLVDLNKETGMAHLSFVENGTLHEIDVPMEALDPKRSRQLEHQLSDPSQLTNHFAPLDIRDFYYRLKRDKDIIAQLSHPALRNSERLAMQVVDGIGYRFNAMWKPLQLFRLGWPQRVLMDEALGRGMAILGPVKWSRYYGGAALTTANNATMRLIDADRAAVDLAARALGHQTKRDIMPMGPGPLSEEAVRPLSSVIQQKRTIASTYVPDFPGSPFVPVAKPERHAKINAVVAEWDAYRRHEQARAAWTMQFEGLAGRNTLPSVRAFLDDTPTPPTGGWVDELMGRQQVLTDVDFEIVPDLADLSPAQKRSLKYGAGLYNKPLPARPNPPIFRATTLAERLRTEGTGRQAAVFDPLTGKDVKADYVVPLPETRFEFPADADFMGPEFGDTLMRWYGEYADKLGSTGFRVMVTPQRELFVARIFTKSKRNKAEKNAFAMLEHTHHRLYDVKRNEWHYDKPTNDLTPTLEAAMAQYDFGWETTFTLNPSDPPLSGPKRLLPEEGATLMHGSGRDLTAEPLLPRDQVGVDRGRLAGPGFYMTDDNLILNERGEWIPSHEGGGQGAVIGGYAYHNPENIYSIRSSRTGKRLKIYDLMREVSERDKRDLVDFVVESLGEEMEFDRFQMMVMDLKDILNDPNTLARQHIGSEYGSPVNWLEVFGSNADRPVIQELITKYLEQKKGAGALRYDGGLMMGGRRHNAYVFLKPEDLEIQSAYSVNKRYVPFVQWLADGADSRPLNPVPANRLHRPKNVARNPMLGELRRVNRLIAERKKTLKAEGKSRYKDRGAGGYADLVRREQELMGGLGLEYKRNMLEGVDIDAEGRHIQQIDPQHGLDDYVVVDADRFDSLVDEARREDYAREDAQTALVGERADEALTEARLLDEEVDRWEALDTEIDDTTRSIFSKVMKYRQQGMGTKTWNTSDGVRMTFPAAFAEHRGHEYRSMSSSKGAIDILSDGHGSSTQLMRNMTGGHKTYNPPVMDDAARTRGTRQFKEAVVYFEQWADLLNDRIAKSPIFQRLMAGQSVDDVVRWLDETPEGARIKREVMPEYSSTWAWVADHQQKLDYYLPVGADGSKVLRRVLQKERLKPSDLRKRVPENLYPSIYGPDIELLDRVSDVRRGLSWAADRMWHGLGTAPIDVLSRQPFFAAMYDLKMRSLVASTDSKWLDNDTIKAEYVETSRKFALEEVRKHLYDLVDQTNMAAALRFVSPFWGAQFEAMKKWSRIVSDRPETVMRIFNLQRAVYNNYVVIDEDGDEVKDIPFLSYDPTHRIIFQVPESLTKTSLGRALATIGTAGVSIGSMNTVLQGESPILPGAGPLVTIPADKFLRKFWPDYAVRYDKNWLYRHLFPIGRPKKGGIDGVLEQLLPGWNKRWQEWQQGADGLSYTNTAIQVARELEELHRKEGKPPPTEAEIQRQVDQVFFLKMTTGLFAPFSVEWRPHNQFLIDAAHDMREQYGADWIDHFLEKYGETAAKYAIASSTSTAGVPATAEGMEEWAENKEMIAKFPEWGSAIIGPQAYLGEFSQDAYNAQFDINLGFGDSRGLRELRSLDERFNEADRLIGWSEYRKFDAMIDAELAARGLTSLSQKDAWDLNMAKRNFVSELRQKYPVWYKEYANPSFDHYSRIDELRQWVYDPRFDQRPDIQGVRQYLQIRDQVAAQLDAWAAQEFGNSRSLQAEQNTELREWFYDQVGQLAQANPAFAEFYGRYLSSDTLDRGSG